MSKVATIASLVRIAARSEAEFIEIVQDVVREADHERTVEFFDRLNIPRSVTSENNLDPLGDVTVAAEDVASYEEEQRISAAIQKFMDRHERKIKWHAGHPSIEGASNVGLVVRASLIVTDMRLQRLVLLLATKEQLSPNEWAIARELMRHAYLSMRNQINLMAGPWIDTVLTTVPREALIEQLGSFYEIVDQWIQKLDAARERIEVRRMELTVVPEGYPPVRPPNYFGGDVLGRGPWKQYWDNLENRAHHFREALG
jgi:hypothetical protein